MTVKKFLLAIVLAPVVIGVLAVAAGFDSSEPSTKSPGPAKSSGPSDVTVPVTKSGHDETYETKKSAKVTNDDDGDEVRGTIVITARSVGDPCAPNENTENETKWCRGGTLVHALDAEVHLKSGKSLTCSEFKDWYWSEPGEFEPLDFYCDVPVKLDDVSSIEVLGTSPV